MHMQMLTIGSEIEVPAGIRHNKDFEWKRHLLRSQYRRVKLDG